MLRFKVLSASAEELDGFSEALRSAGQSITSSTPGEIEIHVITRNDQEVAYSSPRASKSLVSASAPEQPEEEPQADNFDEVEPEPIQREFILAAWFRSSVIPKLPSFRGILNRRAILAGYWRELGLVSGVRLSRWVRGFIIWEDQVLKRSREAIPRAARQVFSARLGWALAGAVSTLLVILLSFNLREAPAKSPSDLATEPPVAAPVRPPIPQVEETAVHEEQPVHNEQPTAVVMPTPKPSAGHRKGESQQNSGAQDVVVRYFRRPAQPASQSGGIKRFSDLN